MTAIGAVAVGLSMSAFHFLGQSKAAEAQVSPAVHLATPLAATLLSAQGFEAQDDLIVRDGTLKSRETLLGLVQELGADSSQAAKSLQVIYDAELLDPRRVRAGMTVQAQFRGNTPETAELVSLSLSEDSGKQILSKRKSDGEFMPVVLQARTQPVERRIKAKINSSIYEAALSNGAHDQQVVDYATIFGYDLDFQRDIQPGDEFEIVYEELVDERGNRVRSGDVLYASLNGKALNKSYYRFTPEEGGEPDYFNYNGESATKFLMKTPINGARLSSSFGYRRHPISGYNKLHKGTDFAAPTGTPIYAAGNGTIERANRYGGYGNYIRIKHANGYSTAYAHMSRFGKYRTGQRVRQGDIIGYVGTTGASTGPHLHYEVMINGKQVNGMKLDLPTGRKLAETPELLKAFIERRDQIDAFRNGDADVQSPAQMLTMTSYEAPPAP
ncbi:M23 family metallopeptidase [Henriciella litoralis]|uniref:M23 family metallopeptidase n=1 Tax=Henriciella litoralis TaxID=568102 RepID=UPI0009FCB7B2|nr:M23 family metallopeptidase [Henriciella litoralis]